MRILKTCNDKVIHHSDCILVEDVLCLLDRVVKHLSDKVVKPELVDAIITLNAALKIHGEEIETSNKAKMDRYQVY